MKNFKNSAGLALVLTGSLLLIGGFLLGLTHHNTLLVTAWLLVTIGIVVHVVIQKRNSQY